MFPSRLLSSLVVVLSFGCARNAVLEIDFDLPPAPVGRYAVVQFENQDAEFTAAWLRTGAYPGTPLGAERQSVTYSVISETMDARVRVKVNFCTTPDCTAIDDAPDRVPAVWFEIERAFYVGRHTRWHVTIPTAPIDPPDEAIEIERCTIAGCVQAPESTESYCRFDGTHFCEPPQ